MSGKTDFSKTDDSTQNQSCPLDKAYIVPVRYALDESPFSGHDATYDELITETPAPHGLPRHWSGRPTGISGLKTRDCTLRQLRDGWLYVYDATDSDNPTLNELEVSDAKIGGSSCLITDMNQQLMLAYSPFQWTERIQSLVLENSALRNRLMKLASPAVTTLQLTLSKLGTTTYWPADCGPIDALGEAVADLAGKPIDNFDSTATSTQREGSALEGIYALTDTKTPASAGAYLADVCDTDNAFFIALDDSLGMLNDLIAITRGHQAELAAFNNQHQNRLQTALEIKGIYGLNIDDQLPEGTVYRPERYKTMMMAYWRYMETGGLSPTAPANMAHNMESARPAFNEAVAAGVPEALLPRKTARSPKNDTIEQYDAASRYQSYDVDMEAALSFACEKGGEQNLLRLQLGWAAEDLVTYLNTLPGDIVRLGFDNHEQTHFEGMTALLMALVQALSSTEDGQQWLRDSRIAHQGLVGLYAYNFDRDLADVFKRAAESFYATGTFGSSIGDVNNVVSRVADLQTLMTSPLFTEASQETRTALTKLRSFLADEGIRSTYTAISYALSGKARQTSSSTILLEQSLAASLLPDQGIQLVYNPPNPDADSPAQNVAFEEKLRRWTGKRIRLQNSLKGLQQSLRRPNLLAHDKRATQINIQRVQQQLDVHDQRRPLRIAIQDDNTLIARGGLLARGASATAATIAPNDLNPTGSTAQSVKGVLSRYGGILPAAIAILNAANLVDSIQTAARSRWQGEDLATVISNIGYTGSATIALWAVPYWDSQKPLKGAIMKGGAQIEIAKVGSREWVGINANYAKIAVTMRLAVGSMALLGLIGASVELSQTYQDIYKNKNSDARSAAIAKTASLVAMSGANAYQVFGAFRGGAQAFARIMSPWLLAGLAIAGLVYLVSSYLYQIFDREGVRYWLHRCKFGQAPNAAWGDNEAGHQAEQAALMHAIYRPAVSVKAVSNPDDTHYKIGTRDVRETGIHGRWVQITFPSGLQGSTLEVSDSLSCGYWADASEAGDIPALDAPTIGFGVSNLGSATLTDRLPQDTTYNANDSHRVWRAWVPVSQLDQHETLVVAIDYSQHYGIPYSPTAGHDYLYRIDSASTESTRVETRDGTDDETVSDLAHLSHAARQTTGSTFSLPVPVGIDLLTR